MTADSASSGDRCSCGQRAAAAGVLRALQEPVGFHTPAGDDTAVLLVTAQAPEIELDGRAVLAFGSEAHMVGRPLRRHHAGSPRSGTVDGLRGAADAPARDRRPCTRRRERRGADATLLRCGGRDSVARAEESRPVRLRPLCRGQAASGARDKSHRHAATPTLDLHIEARAPVARSAEAGSSSRSPRFETGTRTRVCLTHDVDFLALNAGTSAIARFSGFLYRATVGSMCDVVTGRGNMRRLGPQLGGRGRLPAGPPRPRARPLAAVRLVRRGRRRAVDLLRHSVPWSRWRRACAPARLAVGGRI